MNNIQEANSQNTNISCKQKEMKLKQVLESRIQVRNINQLFLKNKVNKKEDNQDSCTKFFSMVIVIVVLFFVAKLQVVHLILEVCN